MSLKRLPLLAVAAAAILAAGCGSDDSGSDTTATSEWADGLCSALTTWQGSITSAFDSLKGGNLSTDALTDAANDAKGATETFVSDLKGLGKPDTEAGEEAKSAIDSLADELSKDVDEIQSAIEGVSGLSGVVAAVTTVSGTLTTMGTQLKSTIDDLQGLDAKGELEDALSQADSCKDLTSS